MKDLFKSKGFTIGFILLSLLIILLTAALIYFLAGNNIPDMPQYSSYDPSDMTRDLPPDTSEELPSDSETESTADTSEETTPEDTTEEVTESETETEEESEEAKASDFRPLHEDEEHKYAILGQVIPEKGTLSVHREEGLIFHVKPQFDGVDEEGNKLVHDGEFPVIGKIFVLSNDGAPAMMYKTEDEFFVSADPGLVSYRAEKTTFTPNTYFTGTYGSSGDKGIVVQVFSEDGNHVAFTIYNDNGGIQTPALENVIAEYEEGGWANFEFKYTDGETYDGMIEFHQSPGSVQVEINFPISCEFDSGGRNYILLNHD